MADEKATCVQSNEQDDAAGAMADIAADTSNEISSAPATGRDRRRLGRLPLFAVGGVLAATMAYALSATDPYWRLNGSEPMPLSTYHRDPGPDPLAGISRPSTALAAVNRSAANVAEPKVALSPLPAYGDPIQPQRLASFSAPMGIPAAPRLAQAARSGLDGETNVVIAIAPLPMPPTTNIADEWLPALAGGGMPAPDLVRHAPVRPHFAADEASEAGLGLDRAGRVDVQRRLALAGFNPSGLDGVFGPRTRGAIREFQTARGFPSTGFLGSAVYADLKERTEEAMTRHIALRGTARKRTARQGGEDLVAAGPDGCLRNAHGHVIGRQSLKCDFVGLSEGFIAPDQDQTADARIQSRAGRGD